MGLRFRRVLPSWNVTFAAEEGVILNAAAVEAYGYAAADDILGVPLTLGDPSLSTETRSVVGVVENFEYTGIAEVYAAGFAANDAPLMLRPDTKMYGHALVRARTGDVAGLRADLKALWTERLDTAHPFQARLYSDVTRMRYGPLEDASLMTACVAGLAILIALLGLLSLAAHHVQSRRKEVGVRKAMGATVREVMVTLSKGFAALVAGAALVAAPLAWLLNRWWLGFFSDGVTVHLGILGVCVIGLVALSLFVIGSQAIQVARLNPATTLRDE
jgi:putative ABC transport system permease protein